MAQLPLADNFEAKTHDDWLALVAKTLKDGDFEKHLTSRSADGIRIAPLYTRDDRLPDALRAVRPGAADGSWDIRTLQAGADAASVNDAVLDDLAGGATSIELQLEAPGRFGLLASKVAIERALSDVRLDAISVAFNPGEDYRKAAETLCGLWIAQNIDKDKRLGAINADPLGVLAASGGLSQSIGAAVKDAAGLAAEQRWSAPGITILAADGRPYHEAGASEAQELACLLATTVSYLRALEAEGCEPQDAWPRIAFHLSADADLFLTIAKLRAARQLLMRLSEACHVQNAHALTTLTVQTSARMMARRDPWVNMLRTTVACAGAALGGADAITVLPYTWAIGQPDTFARRIARNTQLVLQSESSLARVADPAGGSWSIEALSDELAQATWKQFQDIEAAGGLAGALGDGMIQDQICEVVNKRTGDISHGRQNLIGVSAFPHLSETAIEAEPHPAAGAPLQTPASSITPLSRSAWPHRSSSCATMPMRSNNVQALRRVSFWPTSAILQVSARAQPLRKTSLRQAGLPPPERTASALRKTWQKPLPRAAPSSHVSAARMAIMPNTQKPPHMHLRAPAPGTSIWPGAAAISRTH